MVHGEVVVAEGLVQDGVPLHVEERLLDGLLVAPPLEGGVRQDHAYGQVLLVTRLESVPRRGELRAGLPRRVLRALPWLGMALLGLNRVGILHTTTVEAKSSTTSTTVAAAPAITTRDTIAKHVKQCVSAAASLCTVALPWPLVEGLAWHHLA
ncbi:hypothetical protein E2C01_066716 [Portunus trituberculatus]|uniref:Uncharacterized protein n=1 Tax=Portunus trituberculatus TaxID=210409 RepID=A0A5B7HIW7_PORTR|nr:hypothetical protein [Portunus trituberculatus]